MHEQMRDKLSRTTMALPPPPLPTRRDEAEVEMVADSAQATRLLEHGER